MESVRALLNATEDDVRIALKSGSFGNWPQDEADLLEFFILMIDTKLGQGGAPGRDAGLDDPDENFRRLDH